MVDLSIIIVNYNVKHFLSQCLNSLREATNDISSEIIVVDNASVDGSVAHIQKFFPEVHLILNDKNLGFSKANNQGLVLAKGRYALLLNPDTVVQAQTLINHLNYADAHPDVGAIGTKMLDGSGHYLPESKRGFPSPKAALMKMLKISSLFPNSKILNPYYLGHLDKDKIQEVEVLSGAYFFIRKKVLDEIGLLDESFFMYGEDIDLSYRIHRAGHKMIYHPLNPIIHYKGESTKKGSLNYVKHFNQAMIIFAQKHFKKGRANLLSFILRLAVYLRAITSIGKGFIKNTGMLLLFGACLFGGLFMLAEFWAQVRFKDPRYYRDAPLVINFLLYSSVWSFAAYLGALFTPKATLQRFVRNIMLATLILLAIYGILDIEYRSSRAILLMGAALSLGLGYFLQILWNFLLVKRWKFSGNKHKKTVIVGSLPECQRVQDIIDQSDAHVSVFGFVSPDKSKQSTAYLTHADHLKSLIGIENIDEIVFCLKDINIHQVMQQMSRIGGHVEYKIIGDESLSIVGSKSKNTQGEWYSVDIEFKLNKRGPRLSKRAFDLTTAGILLLTSPVVMIIQKSKSAFIQNTWEVFVGRKTWVSYGEIGPFLKELPKLKAGILHPLSGKNVESVKSLSHKRANLVYAKEYHWNKDLEILWKSLNYIGDV